MPIAVQLRDVVDADLPIFFEHQQDPTAVQMAAFTAKDPSDRAAFMAHWAKIRADSDTTIQTVLFQGAVAGSVLCYGPSGETEVSYWLGRSFWGQGIATAALQKFLGQVTERPLFARVAQDNIGSLRVLQKCGFIIVGEEKGFAQARGTEIPEYVLTLLDG